MPAAFKKQFNGIMNDRPKQANSLPLPDTMILGKPVIIAWLDHIEDPVHHLSGCDFPHPSIFHRHGDCRSRFHPEYTTKLKF